MSKKKKQYQRSQPRAQETPQPTRAIRTVDATQDEGNGGHDDHQQKHHAATAKAKHALPVVGRARPGNPRRWVGVRGGLVRSGMGGNPELRDID